MNKEVQLRARLSPVGIIEGEPSRPYGFDTESAAPDDKDALAEGLRAWYVQLVGVEPVEDADRITAALYAERDVLRREFSGAPATWRRIDGVLASLASRLQVVYEEETVEEQDARWARLYVELSPGMNAPEVEELPNDGVVGDLVMMDGNLYRRRS